MPDIQEIANSQVNEWPEFTGFVPLNGNLVGIIDGIACEITADEIRSVPLQDPEKLAELAKEKVRSAKEAANYDRETLIDITPGEIDEQVRIFLERCDLRPLL